MADARYIIDLLLRARDDTARAVASATGNLAALDDQSKKTKESLESVGTADMSGFRSTLRAIRQDSDEAYTGVKKLDGAVKDLKDRDRLKLKPEMDFGQMKREMDRMGLELKKAQFSIKDFEGFLEEMGGKLDKQTGKWERNSAEIKKWAEANGYAVSTANKKWAEAKRGFDDLDGVIRRNGRSLERLSIQWAEAQAAMSDDTGPNRLEYAWGEVEGKIRKVIKAQEEGNIRGKQLAEGELSALRQQISAMEELHTEEEVIATFEEELHAARSARAREVLEQIDTESRRLEKMRLGEIDNIDKQMRKLDELQERFERIGGDGDQSAARIKIAVENIQPTIDDINRVDRELEKLTNAAIKPGLSQRDKEIAEADLRRFVERMERIMPDIDLRVQMHRQEGFAQQAEDQMLRERDARLKEQAAERAAAARQAAENARAEAQAARELTNQRREAARLSREWEQTIQRAARLQRDRETAGDMGLNPEHLQAIDRQLERTRRKLAELGVAIKMVSLEDLQINVDVDDTEAIGQLTAFAVLKEAIERDIDVQVDVDVAGAMAELAAFDALKRTSARAPDDGGSGWRAYFGGIVEAAQRSGTGIAAFDNQVRGMVTLVIGAAIQPLMTSVMALGAELGALASSATVAGAALGGGLAAGAMQALPAIGLLGSAIHQIGGVSDVFKQMNLLEQQQHTEAMKPPTATDTGAPDRVAAANDAVKNAVEGVADAEDALADANERVTESQQRLNEAREEAERQLEDLMMAEREAHLAARGASLSQEEAQRALNRALAEGRIEDIEEARLRLDEANLGVEQAQRRAQRAEEDATRARKQGIEKMPGVRSAKEALEDAHKAAEDAADGVEKAKRSLDGAKRGLDAAGESAASVGDNFLSAEGKLDYLMDKLSLSQRKMLVAALAIRDTYRKEIAPLTDVIVDALTNGMIRANQILNDPRFLRGIGGLSDEIANSINSLVNSFTDQRSMEQFLTLIAMSRDNLGDLTGVVEDFGHAFIDISVAANPVMQELIGWAGDLGEKLRDVTSNERKMFDFFEEAADHLRAWLDLGGAVGSLFVDIIQAGAADEGLLAVESMTRAIRRASDWVNTHRVEVREFLQEVREVVGIIMGVLWEATKAIGRTFEGDRVRDLAEILTDVLIPALEQAIEWLGVVLGLFNDISNIPFVGDMMKYGLAFMLLAGIIGKFVTLLLPITAIFRGLPLLVMGAAMAGGWTALFSRFGRVGTFLATFLKAIPGVRQLGRALLGLAPATMAGGAAAGAAGAAGAGAAGAGGAAAAGAGANVGKTFMSGFKSVVKKAGFIGVGLSALDGIVTGFKTGSLENGIRDFASSLTFGIIDSTEERATKALGRLTEEYQEAARKIRQSDPGDRPSAFKDGYFAPERTTTVNNNVPLGIDPRTTTLGPSQFEKDLDAMADAWDEKVDDFWGKVFDREQLEEAGFTQEQIDEMIGNEKLAVSIRDAGQKMQGFWRKVEDMRVNADKKNVLFDPDTLINAMEQAARKAPEQLRPMYDLMIAEAKRAARVVERELKPEQLGIQFSVELQRNPKQWKKVTDEALQQVKTLPPELRKEGYKSIREMADGMAAAGIITKSKAENIKETVTEEIRDTRRAAKKHTYGLLKDTVTNMGYLARAVSVQLLGLTERTNNILKKLGASAINLGAMAGIPGAGAIQGLLAGASSVMSEAGAATGFAGMPGERGKDHPRLMVGRGEAVLNWAQQAAVNARLMGQDTIQSIMGRVRGWHAGGSEQLGFAVGAPPTGAFDGHPTNVNAGIRQIIMAIKRRFPLTVTSTTDHSRLTSSGNVSDHWTGDAVDISGAKAHMDRAAAWVLSSGLAKKLKQGIYSGNPSLTINQGQNVGAGFFGPAVMGQHANHLHLAIAGAVGKLVGDIKTKLKKIDFEWPGGGALERIGQRQIDMVREAAQKKLNKAERDSMRYDAAAPSGAGEPAPPGQVREWLTRALKIVGIFSQANLSALYGRAMQESGGNPRAINLWDSNAAAGIPSKGLLQTIDPTFQAYKMKGMDNIWNPIHNAVAALRYMLARYGHVVGPSSTGYYFGGRTPGREGQPFPTMLHGDEHVVTAREVRNAPGGHNFFYALRRLLGGGSQSTGGGYQYGGRTLMIGDSLGVGMEALLKKMIDGLSADNVGGRNSSQGLAVLKSKLTDAYRSVIFEMGTNDYTAEMMANNIRRAYRMVGRDREFVVSTVRGREAGAKNEWLREFAAANPNVRLVRGAQVNQGLASDGIHYGDYTPLARAFAAELRGGAPGRGGLPFNMAAGDVAGGAYGGPGGKDRTYSTKDSIRMPWERFATYDEDIRHERELERLEEKRREAEKIENEERQKRALERVKELEKAEDKRHERIMDQIEKVLSKEEERWDAASERQRQRMTVQHGLYAQRAIATPTTVRGLETEIDVLWKAVENIEGKTLGSALRKFMFNINELAGEGGLLDQMQVAIENRSADLANALALDTFRGGFERIRRRGETIVRATRDVRQRLRPDRVARAELRNMERTGVDLVEMRQEERRAMRKIENRIDRLRRGGIQDDEREDFRELMAARVRITEKLRASDAAIAQNLSDRFAKQVEVFQAETERRLRRPQRRQQAIATQLRMAQFTGNTDMQGELMQENIALLRQQMRILRRRMKRAQEKGMTDYAEELRGQIADIFNQITDQVESFAAWVIDQISKQASRRSTYLGLFERLAGVQERAGDRMGALRMRQNIAAAEATSIQTEMSQIQGVLASGVQLSAEQRQALVDRLAELGVALAENTQTQHELMLATYSLTAEIVQARAQFFTGAFGGLQSIVNSLGGSLAEQAENLEGIKNALLEANQGLVNNIMSNPVFANALSAFGIDVGAQGQDFVDEMQDLLSNWDTITAGMDQNTKDLLMALIQQLIDNQAAIADNTNQLEQLNGSTELQGFTSSSWELFRQAIFDGLGGLLPQYQVPQAHTGGIIPKTGIYELEVGEEVLTNAQRMAIAGEDGSGDTINLYVTEPTEMVDTTYIANRIAHAKKTRGR